jgi:FkbM family methyltransferase
MSTDALSILYTFASPEALVASMGETQPPVTALRSIAILGAAAEGIRLAALCAEQGIAIVAMLDDNPELQGHTVAGCVVRPVAEAAALDPSIPVVLSTHRLLPASERLQALGIQNWTSFAYLQVALPDRFTPHMYYRDWASDLVTNRDRYTELRRILADDESRRVFDAILGFRLTLDPKWLAGVVDAANEYYPPDVIRLGEDEVYIDGGAWDGDSIVAFKSRCRDRFKRAISFEPSPDTHAKLIERVGKDPRVTCIAKGLADRSDVLRFSADGTRAAKFGEEGAVDVPVTSLDEVLNGSRASFIKINIEGSEAAFLEGAKRTIARWRPKIALCAYHYARDLWALPAQLRTITEGYDYFLRQHDGGTIQTVIYAVPAGEMR